MANERDLRDTLTSAIEGGILTANSAVSPEDGFNSFVIADRNARPFRVCLVENNSVSVVAVGEGQITFSAPTGNMPFRYFLVGDATRRLQTTPIEDTFLRFRGSEENPVFLDFGGGRLLKVR